MSWDIIGRADSKLYEVGPSEVSDILSDLVATDLWLRARRHLRPLESRPGCHCYGVDFNEENLPQEVGGTVRRSASRKAVIWARKRWLGSMRSGMSITDCRRSFSWQRRAGERHEVDLAWPKKLASVTSAAFSPRLSAPLALAMVRREANSPGTRLESAIGECEVVAFRLRVEYLDQRYSAYAYTVLGVWLCCDLPSPCAANQLSDGRARWHRQAPGPRLRTHLQRAMRRSARS